MKNIAQMRAYAWIFFVFTILLLLLLEGFTGILLASDTTTSAINALNTQRAREARMVKDVLVLEYRPQSERAQSLSELQDILPLWEQTQQGVQGGNTSLGFLVHPPLDVALLLTQAQSDYIPLDVALRSVTAHHATIDPLQVQIIQEHDRPYTLIMNQVSVLWSAHSSEALIYLFWIKSGIVAVLLIVIVLSFWCLTRPALRYITEEPSHLQRDITQLQMAFEEGRSEVAQDFVSRDALEQRLQHIDAQIRAANETVEALKQTQDTSTEGKEL
jgi:hypothetical protein